MGVGRRNAFHGVELGTSVEVSDPGRGIPPIAGSSPPRAGTSSGRAIPRGHAERERRSTAPVRCGRRGWRCTSSRELAASDRSGAPHELRAPPAVPAAVESRRGRGSRGRRRSPGGGARQRGCAHRSEASSSSWPLGLGLYSRHWLLLARRSAVGARSEDAVQRALAPLQAEGWRLRHSRAVAGPGRHRLGGDRARPGSRSRSRPRPERTTRAISLACASRRRGCRGAGEGGHATARSASCASFVPGASSESSRTSSCVSIDRLTDVLRVAARMVPTGRTSLEFPCHTRRLPVDPAITVYAKGASARSALLLGECDRELRLRPVGLA